MFHPFCPLTWVLSHVQGHHHGGRTPDNYTTLSRTDDGAQEPPRLLPRWISKRCARQFSWDRRIMRGLLARRRGRGGRGALALNSHGPMIDCVIVEVEVPVLDSGVLAFVQAVVSDRDWWPSSLGKLKAPGRACSPAINLAASIAGAIGSIFVEEFGPKSYSSYPMANVWRISSSGRSARPRRSLTLRPS